MIAAHRLGIGSVARGVTVRTAGTCRRAAGPGTSGA